MTKFKDFQTAVNSQFSKMANGKLFKTDVSKDSMWETYLISFPEGTNPIYKEKTEHDCNCCKGFIRAAGNVVSIVDNKLVSIWDVEPGGHYNHVAKDMSNLVKSFPVRDIFLSPESNLGKEFNLSLTESGSTLRWEHFHFELPNNFVMDGASIGSKLSSARSAKGVFWRGLHEFTVEALDTVIELGEQNSTYRVAEFMNNVINFKTLKTKFDLITDEDEKHNFCWSTDTPVAMLRNTMIGTLITDLSEGMDLNTAVSRYESKAAPENYKRPKALITKAMINKAQEKVSELGIQDALSRRYAVTDDITIGNVLYADRSVKRELGVFDELLAETEDRVKNLDKVDEVHIHDFINDIMPKAKSIELMFDNKHKNNLVSLIAPVHADAKPILKWGNNFSWNYNGEVTDSMRERVKKAGGNVEGALRFSIRWNDGDNNQNDFDAHCVEPSGNIIYFENKNNYSTTGVLDVDIINPGVEVAVENITWSDKSKMLEGTYKFLVHNFDHCGGITGFTAEIEYEGKIYSYDYNKELRNGEKVEVATVEFSREKGIKFIYSLPSQTATREIWRINTNKFHKVRMIMNSPNHWDGSSTGNKHYFFMLENCLNEGTARGFFNEFLDESLTEHRKVFEVLGSKMRVEPSEEQLSGLGFSTTKRNEVLCKVTGSFSRVIKIKF